MAETRTLRMTLPQWSAGTDSPTRLDFNEAFANLEDRAAIDASGTFTARPAATAANRGTYYHATDTGVISRSTGAAWVVVGSRLAPEAAGDVVQEVNGLTGQSGHLSRWLVAGVERARLEADGDLLLQGTTAGAAGSGAFRARYLTSLDDTGTYLDNGAASGAGMSFIGRTAIANTVLTVSGMTGQTGPLQSWTTTPGGSPVAQLNSLGALTLTGASANLTVGGTATVSGASQLIGTTTIGAGGTGTAGGTLIVAAQASNVGSGSAVQFQSGSTQTWQLYKLAADANLYIRDLVNSKMQVTFVPGATDAAATTTIHSKVTANALLTVAAGGAAITGNTTVAGTFGVTGANLTSLGGDLTVAGASTLAGLLTANGGVNVVQAVNPGVVVHRVAGTVDARFYVTTTANAGAAGAAVGDTIVRGEQGTIHLGIAGGSTLRVGTTTAGVSLSGPLTTSLGVTVQGGGIAVTGNSTVAGTFGVTTGLTTLGAGLTVTGTTSLAGTTVSGTITQSGGGAVALTGQTTITRSGTGGLQVFAGGASPASVQVGRTATDLELGAAAAAGNFLTGTATGDTAIRTLAGTLHLGVTSTSVLRVASTGVDISGNLSFSGSLSGTNGITTDGTIRTTSAAAYLDLSTSAATDVSTGTGIGDKISLYGASGAGRYGFGVQTGALVAYVNPSAAFVVRATSATGQGSSTAANSHRLSADGTLASTGSHTAAGIISTGTVASSFGGAVGVTGLLTASAGVNVTGGTLRVTASSDVTLASTAHAFQIGVDTATNIAFDTNEIQARNNGAAASLALNALGGSVVIGTGGLTVQGGGAAVTGAVSATTTVTAGTGLTVTTGNIEALNGDLLARSTDATSGYMRIARGSTNNSGSVQFYQGNGTRGGFIGGVTTSAAADAGTINYSAGTHTFLGAATISNGLAVTGAVSGTTTGTFTGRVSGGEFLPTASGGGYLGASSILLLGYYAATAAAGQIARADVTALHGGTTSGTGLFGPASAHVSVILNPNDGVDGFHVLAPGSSLAGGERLLSVKADGEWVVGGGKRAFQFGATDTFLRINDTNSFTGGVWLGNSSVRMSRGSFRVGSDGTDSANVLVSPHASDLTRRITLDGGTGNVTITGDLNVTGSVTPNDTTPGASTGFTAPGGSTSWDRLVVKATTLYGDGVTTTPGEDAAGGTRYVTLGAGGAAGVMLSGAHVVNVPGNGAYVRFGRVGGVSTGARWDAGFHGTTDAFIIKRSTNENTATTLTLTPQMSISPTGVATVSGGYLAPLGAVGAPSYSFTGDTNTGLYSPGADQLALTTGGTNAMTLSALQVVNIPTGSLLVGSSTQLSSTYVAEIAAKSVTSIPLALRRFSTAQTGDMIRVLTAAGDQTFWGVTHAGFMFANGQGAHLRHLPTPAAPTLSTVGTAGTTTYSYRIAAVNEAGTTIAGVAATISTGNAVLDATNRVRLTWTAVAGAQSYNVYGRVAGSEGLLGNVVGATTFDDTGQAVGVAAPTTTTGLTQLTVDTWATQTGALFQWRSGTTAGTPAVLGSIDSTGRIQAPLGTVALPAYTFLGDTDTGFASPTANQIDFVAGGASRANLTTTLFTVGTGLTVSGTISAPVGTTALPSITFTGDTDTGLAAPTANRLELVAGGASRMALTSTGIETALTVTNVGGAFLSQRASAPLGSSAGVAVGVTGEANYRTRIETTGEIQLGIGSAAPDVRIDRVGTGDGAGLRLYPATGSSQTAGFNWLTVKKTTLWGDGILAAGTAGEDVAGGTRYLTLTGDSGVMLSHPHVAWTESVGGAEIRWGRSSGKSTGAWWFTGVNNRGNIGTADSATSRSFTIGVGGAGTTAGDAGADVYLAISGKSGKVIVPKGLRVGNDSSSHNTTSTGIDVLLDILMS